MIGRFNFIINSITINITITIQICMFTMVVPIIITKRCKTSQSRTTCNYSQSTYKLVKHSVMMKIIALVMFENFDPHYHNHNQRYHTPCPSQSPSTTRSQSSSLLQPQSPSPYQSSSLLQSQQSSSKPSPPHFPHR